MLDVLTITRDNRLAGVELKADEDIHLPLQGLDYWSRVEWLHARGEFRQFGYFPGRELSSADPLLFLVAPTLHIHPASDTVLHYLSPEIDCNLSQASESAISSSAAQMRRRTSSPANLRALGVDCVDPEIVDCKPAIRSRTTLSSCLAVSLASPTDPGDMRCGRLPAAPGAVRSGHRPREAAQTSRSSGSPRASAWLSGLFENS